MVNWWVAREGFAQVKIAIIVSKSTLKIIGRNTVGKCQVRNYDNVQFVIEFNVAKNSHNFSLPEQTQSLHEYNILLPDAKWNLMENLLKNCGLPQAFWTVISYSNYSKNTWFVLRDCSISSFRPVSCKVKKITLKWKLQNINKHVNTHSTSRSFKGGFNPF